MKRWLVTFLTVVALHFSATAQQPLYFVNGVEKTQAEVSAIDESDIERTEMPTVDEQLIAHYGQRASVGVVLITLRYDHESQFSADGETSFARYIASHVKWAANDPTARVVLRYTVGTDGKATLDKLLESTDTRLRRKVLTAFEAAPAWTPASKNGKPVACKKVLRVQLPEGRSMPKEKYVVIL